MAEPAVSVVIPNLNRADLLLECLESLERQRFRDFEVIVVDQASSDDSAARVQERFGEAVKVIVNSANLGFAEGCNVGIRASRGRWIALLNNDALADPRWLEEAVKAGRARPRVGLVACLILDRVERDRIDNVGVGLYPDGMNRGRARGERAGGLYGSGYDAFLPSGCACLLRREMLDEIGLFDPSFFAYSEDTDLGLRARLSGWRCAFAPRAAVYHHYSSTAGKVSGFKVFHAERNRLWLLFRYYPALYLALSPAWTLLRYLALVPAWWKMKAQAGASPSPVMVVMSILKAHGSALARLGEQWAWRKAWLKRRRVSAETWAQWLKQYRISLAELSAWD